MLSFNSRRVVDDLKHTAKAAKDTDNLWMQVKL